MSERKPRRFFSDDSFWNTPIPRNAEIDPRSDHFTDLLMRAAYYSGVGINLTRWTIPVYEVDGRTPRRRIHRRPNNHPDYVAFGQPFGHGPGFGPEIPIPDRAEPDPQDDSHMAMVDWTNMRAWDMWWLRRRDDGDWESATGMTYALDGPGVFDRAMFHVQPGESIHFHGPSRAAGVPAIAGLIMLDEVRAGRIEHKLPFACGCNALCEFVWPATWADGQLPGGIPEGAVIRLDPDLDLSQFHLSPGATVVARALQEYGAVNVDSSGGNGLYAEHPLGKPGSSWEGLLDPFCITHIEAKHYRVLKLGEVVRGGKIHPARR